MPCKIDIYYQSHSSLRIEDFEALALSFLKKRIRHFLGLDSEWFAVRDRAELLERTATRDSERMVLFLSVAHPIVDEKLLGRMIDLAKTRKTEIRAEGAVPGTDPFFVATSSSLADRPLVRLCATNLQRRYNTQLNLFRPKRAKVFQLLVEKFPDLHAWPLTKLLDFCGSREGTEFLLAYGSKAPLQFFKKCPLCGSEERVPLHCDTGHPVAGFFTRDSEFYYQCQDCRLVYLNPHLPEEELGCYYDLCSYDNVLGFESLASHFDSMIPANTSAFYNYEASLPYLQNLPEEASCLDLGGGIGEFAVYAKKRFPRLRPHLIDFRIDQVIGMELKKRGISARDLNFITEPLERCSYDLVTTWEVIEHLPITRLKGFFWKVHNALKPGGLYILSTPDFENPYCRALDFWAAYPGEHLSVLSRRVLEPLLTGAGFEIIDERHESVTVKGSGRWFHYASEYGAAPSARAEASIIEDFLKNEALITVHHETMRKKNLGSELILCARKK